MQILVIILSLLSSNMASANHGDDDLIKSFSHRFQAYTIAPNQDLSEEEKKKRIETAVKSSKFNVLNNVRALCSEYESRSGWRVKTWEANDFGWISGEGEVSAVFSCMIRKGSGGGCHEPSCSLGCHVYGGRCCIDQFCSIY